MLRTRLVAVVASIMLIALDAVAWASQPVVVGLNPPRNALNVEWNTTVTIQFDQPILLSSITSQSFRVFGRWSGTASGTFTFSNGDATVTFTPDHAFFAGDPVTVTLSHDVRAADNTPLRSAGYSYRFTTKALPAAMNFIQIDQMTSRTVPNINTRIYGGVGCDVNKDGFPDITTINEDSADVRIFLNRAEGNGLFHPFTQPPTPINFESSPHEPGDFNNDGNVDLAIGSSATSVVSILLGNGDGTFAPQQTIAVGSTPHGIAVLDVDGDGDMDVASSNTGGDNCSLLINPGNGIFTTSTNFEGGGSGEYALGSADMDDDGIMDLVVGARNSQQIIVHKCNGNGTFTIIETQNAAGLVWQLGTGDMNGDGKEDVHTANSGSGTGSILLGLGAGQLGNPTTTATVTGVVATDIGDLDGDGDLDWVLSSFGGSRWRLFKNNGAGGMTFDEEFVAVSNPACATIMDFDLDGDLDLVLFDEIADVVQLKRNLGPAIDGDMNCDGRTDGKDVKAFVTALLSAASYNSQYPYCLINNADVNDDNLINNGDVAPFAALLANG